MVCTRFRNDPFLPGTTSVPSMVARSIMQRLSRYRLGPCLVVLGLIGFAPEAIAQWGFWGPSARSKPRGALSARFGRPSAVSSPRSGQPILVADPDTIELPPAGVEAIGPEPPWHDHRVVPEKDPSVREQERQDYLLNRMLLYRTREHRYGDDFSDRYATGDMFYHMSRSRLVAPQVVDPSAWVPPRGSTPAASSPSFSHGGVVPGMSFVPGDGRRRGHISDEELPEQLRAAANRLTSSLSRMTDGDVWLGELQPQRIVAAIDRGEDPAAFGDLIARYEAVARDRRLVLVARANGFEETHRWLIRYVSLPGPYPLGEGDWQGMPSIIQRSNTSDPPAVVPPANTESATGEFVDPLLPQEDLRLVPANRSIGEAELSPRGGEVELLPAPAREPGE